MQICRELNEKGARRQRVEKPFTHQIIRCILGNESYVGDKRLQKQAPKNFLTKRPDPTVPYATNFLTDHHEAIVSRALWNAVQERLKQEENARKEGVRRAGTPMNYMEGLSAADAERPIYGVPSQAVLRRPGEKVLSKIWCCKGKITGSGCRNPNIREDVLLRRVAGGGKAMINREGEVVAMM